MASIRKLDTNKGTAYVIDYYDTNGKRRQIRRYCSKSEAEALKNKIEHKKSRVKLGLYDEVKKIKLFHAIEKYIVYSEMNKAASTVSREKRVYKQFKKFINNIPIREIEVENVENYVRKRYKKDDLSPDTIGLELRTLKAFFNYLIDREYISKNPVNRVEVPKRDQTSSNTNVRFLTMDEIERLFSVIDSKDFEDLVKVYLNTGARRSEVLPPKLTWQNVDFKNRTLQPTVKGGGTNTINMNETVYSILKRRYDDDNKYPFDFSPDWTYRKIKKYYNEADIENANVHTLRKTFGSLLLQRGTPLKVVSQLLGHCSVTVTENHYAALLEDNLQDAVNKLDDVF